MRAILGHMDMQHLMKWFTNLKPQRRMVLVAVLVGGAVLLILPLVLGIDNYPIANGDSISSWKWDGAYADRGTKQAQATQEIAHLKAMLGKDSKKDYSIIVGIASQYELLGDGRSAYHYLSKAIAKDRAQGLAYMNMGQLMEGLGAFRTARNAYDAALKAEPASGLYASARDSFYAHHPQQ